MKMSTTLYLSYDAVNAMSRSRNNFSQETKMNFEITWNIIYGAILATNPMRKAKTRKRCLQHGKVTERITYTDRGE